MLKSGGCAEPRFPSQGKPVKAFASKASPRTRRPLTLSVLAGLPPVKDGRSPSAYQSSVSQSAREAAPKAQTAPAVPQNSARQPWWNAELSPAFNAEGGQFKKVESVEGGQQFNRYSTCDCDFPTSARDHVTRRISAPVDATILPMLALEDPPTPLRTVKMEAAWCGSFRAQGKHRAEVNHMEIGALRDSAKSFGYEVTDQHREAAERLAARYANSVEDCKAFQASWRKRHDALVEKRRASKEAMSKIAQKLQEADSGSDGFDDCDGRSSVAIESVPSRAGSKPKAVTVLDEEIDDERSSLKLPLVERQTSGQSVLVKPLLQTTSKKNNVSDEKAICSTPGRTLSTVSQNEEATSSISMRKTLSTLSQGRRSLSKDRTPRASRTTTKDTTTSTSEDADYVPKPHVIRFDDLYADDEVEEEATGAISRLESDGGPMGSKTRRKSMKMAALHNRPDLADSTSVLEASFDITMILAKKHGLTVDFVKELLDKFKLYDIDGDGVLSEDEFRDAVRESCGIPKGQEAPHHLTQTMFGDCDLDGDEGISFEEFLVWGRKTAYAEEFMVPDPEERYLRSLARQYGFPLIDVEKIRKLFCEFDLNGNGSIDQEEFRPMMHQLMKVKDPSQVSEKKLNRFWKEVDSDHNGNISFEEFAVWYYKLFIEHDS